MNKFKISKILMLLLLAALIIITPFLSSSFRTTYLYFITNLLIIAVGAEAGLLSNFSKPHEDKKPCAPPVKPTCSLDTHENSKQECEEKGKIMRKSVSEKANKNIGIVKLHEKINKSSSMPSIFFIGGEENEQEEVADYYDVNEETDGLSGQELFTKAETFIGNFYMQLKMQKELSWKRIHGV